MRARRELLAAIALSATLTGCEAASSPQDNLPPSGIIYSTPIPEHSLTIERRRPLNPREIMLQIITATNIKFVMQYNKYPGAIVRAGENVGVMVDRGVLRQLSTRGIPDTLVVPDTTSETIDRKKFKDFGDAAIYAPNKFFLESLDDVVPLGIARSLPEIGEGVIVVGDGPQEAIVKNISSNDKIKGFSIKSLAAANLQIRGAMVIKLEDGMPKVSGFLPSSDALPSKENGEEVFIQRVIPVLEQ